MNNKLHPHQKEELADLAVARLAAGEALADREPLYLRRPDAAPNVVAKSALG